MAEAGSTMQEVVESIRRVTDIMGEITSASQEQSQGTEQVNRAVAQMDEVTQQNAALAEEAVAASQSLQDQAAGLSGLVSVFRLDGHEKPETVALQASPAAGATPLRPEKADHRQPLRHSPTKLAIVRQDTNEWKHFR